MAAILGKNEDSMYIFITCDSLEEFDQKTNGIPSNVYVYADIKGQVAEMFGMRPSMAVIDVKDIFSGQQKKSYEKQTLTGTFFVVGNKIVKNPGYQPKLQQASIAILKTGFEFLDKIQYDINLATSKGSFGEDMTEKELQTVQKQAWDLYQEEYNQMLQDLGQKSFKGSKPPLKKDEKKEIPKKTETEAKEDKKETPKKVSISKETPKESDSKDSVIKKETDPKGKKPSLLKKKEKVGKKEPKKIKKKDEKEEPKPLRSKL